MDNEALLKVLELDNKFDYEKNTRIVAAESGYDVIEEEQKVTALEEKTLDEIFVSTTDNFKELSRGGLKK
jgi:hypothetical protein